MSSAQELDQLNRRITRLEQTIRSLSRSSGSGGIGVTDHGALTGLGDDDHSQYHNDGRANTWLAGKNSDDITEGTANLYMDAAEASKLAGIEAGADVTDAGNVAAAIDGVTEATSAADANKLALIVSGALRWISWMNVKVILKTYFDELYLIVAGVSGGQTAHGGTAASNNLVMRSTSHATKGYILLGDDGSYVGVGPSATTPVAPFDVEAGDMAAQTVIAQYGGHPNAAGNAYINYYHTHDYDVANKMVLELDLNVNNAGANQRRAAMQFIASFDNITSATRNSLVEIGTAIAGTFATALGMTGKKLGLFNAAASPQGALHIHDGTGGWLKKSFTSQTFASAVTVIPDGAGDVLYELAGRTIVRSSTGYAQSITIGILPGSSTQIFSSSGNTLDIAVAANGAVTLVKTGGTASYIVSIDLQWL